MEWTCARCGQLAEEATWTGLTDLGWRLNEGGDCTCADCTMRQWPATRRSLGDPQPGLRLSPSLAGRTRPAAYRPDAVESVSRSPATRARPHLALVK